MGIESFLQINTWGDSEKHFIYRSFLIAFFISGISLFSQTFRILFIYDNYGIFEGGLYLALLGLVSFLLDYPTANLSDRIGQRGVMILALFTHSIAIYLLATTTSETSFYLSAIIDGIAMAQFSGTLRAWFDNNYKFIASDFDKDYFIYMDLMTKANVISYVGVFCFSVTGGYIATYISRDLGLLTEVVLSLAIIFIVLLVMTDLNHLSNNNIVEKKSIMFNFKAGLQFFFESKQNFFLLSSAFLVPLEAIIFTQTLFIPLYFAYTGSELLISLADRIQVIITMLIQMLLMKYLLSKIKNLGSYIYFFLLGFLMFSMIPVIIFFYPFTNKIDIIPLTLLWFLFLLLDFFNLIGSTLFNRKKTMIIPSDIRNSIYSLSSSLTTLASLVIIPLVNFLYASYSMIYAMIILVLIKIFALVVLFIEKNVDSNQEVAS